MKIGIIGTGAMGSIYASFLSKNNNEDLVIDIWEEHLEAIKNNGLRVSGFSGDNVVENINVSSNIEDAIIAKAVKKNACLSLVHYRVWQKSPSL